MRWYLLYHVHELDLWDMLPDLQYQGATNLSEILDFAKRINAASMRANPSNSPYTHRYFVAEEAELKYFLKDTQLRQLIEDGI